MDIARSSGILLHPTSLPGAYGVGDLGRSAREFVDALAEARQSWWQILPLNPPGHGGSPYSATSAFAGNPVLVDLEALAAEGWLEDGELADLAGRCQELVPDRFAIGPVTVARLKLLDMAYERWLVRDRGTRDEFDAFCTAQQHWLDDYALYVALKEVHGGKDWRRWGEDFVARKPRALKEAHLRLEHTIRRAKFRQWLFSRQWSALREYAGARGVRFIGDIPIFVAMDSADAWSHRELFQMDDLGRPRAISGVPPDYFSATGQRWGNPLYDWGAMAKNSYQWWIRRIAGVLATVDIARVDHFRGFEAYWAIPPEEPTAIHGEWIKGPGDEFFEAVNGALGAVPFIAENLGVITEEVEALRKRQNLPGMRIFQFAFDGDPDNAYLPHRYPPNTVGYTGTHDNDTTMGWYENTDDATRHGVRSYLSCSDGHIVWSIMEALLASRANLVVFPAQDVFELGSEARMNLPGQPDGNWNWRLTSEHLADHAAWRHLGELTDANERALRRG